MSTSIPTTTNPYKIITHNLGDSKTQKNPNLLPLAIQINKENPDIICIQDISNKSIENMRSLLTEFHVNALKYPTNKQTSAYDGAYGGAYDRESNNRLLILFKAHRFTLLQDKKTNPVSGYPIAKPFCRIRLVDNNQKDKSIIDIMNLHLSSRPGGFSSSGSTILQNYLKEFSSQNPGDSKTTIILAGDLGKNNTIPTPGRYNLLKSQGFRLSSSGSDVVAFKQPLTDNPFTASINNLKPLTVSLKDPSSKPAQPANSKPNCSVTKALKLGLGMIVLGTAMATSYIYASSN